MYGGSGGSGVKQSCHTSWKRTFPNCPQVCRQWSEVLTYIKSTTNWWTCSSHGDTIRNKIATLNLNITIRVQVINRLTNAIALNLPNAVILWYSFSCCADLNHKIIFADIHKCNFATVTNRNEYLTCRISALRSSESQHHRLRSAALMEEGQWYTSLLL